MHRLLSLVLALVLVFAGALPAVARGKRSSAKKHPAASPARDGQGATEAATRLQVFLDRSNFSPGRLDGQYNNITLRALALYRQARGEQPGPPPAKAGIAPDLTGLDLASVGDVVVPYQVSDADMQSVGPLPSDVVAQAKLKFLPYRSALESIAEKFHSDPHFLEQLNPGRTKAIKVGDRLRVPNVEPFDLGAVRNIKPGSEVSSAEPANEIGDEPEPPQPSAPEAPAPPVSVRVDTKLGMLGVYEAEKLVAAYPITIGSVQTQSPIGEWKIRGLAKLPRYRHDEEMLKHGVRSAKFQMLPPGPNSPVGVLWIALNKKGIGLHGTSEPDTIGRSVSHGCVRLANWDIVRLALRVKGGVPVSIH